MKSLDLKLANVQAMNDDELRLVDGGVMGWDDFLVWCAIAGVGAIFNDWDNFKAGLAAGAQ